MLAWPLRAFMAAPWRRSCVPYGRRQKVSGSMRTLTGARDYTDIRSYLATAVKHGIRFIDALTTLTEHRPWLPQAA